MSKINDLNTRLASYVEEAEDIKEKIKNIAVNKNISIEAGVDTPLDVLDNIDQETVKPSGNINLTTLNSTNVANYETAQVVDANLIAGNIKDGVSVLGLTGTFTGDADATITDILPNKKAYVQGNLVVGNMPIYGDDPLEPTEITPTTSSQTLLIGNKYANSNITVNAIPSQYKDTTGMNATSGDILAGKTAVSENGNLTGTIQSKTAETYTPTTTDQTIAAGQYLSGAQTIKGDINLTAENIVSGVTIFDVEGTATIGTDVSDTTATAADVLVGKYFYTRAGVKTEGTITSGSATVAGSETVTPNLSVNPTTGIVTGSVSDTLSITPTVTAGYITAGTAGSITVTGSDTLSLSDYVDATKVLSGQTILGVSGTATDDADAVAGDIIASKTAYVNGMKITGNIPSKTSSDINIIDNFVTVPTGYYARNEIVTIPSGTATISESESKTVTPTLSINPSTGEVTSSVNGTLYITPSVTPGYISYGTQGHVDVSGSRTLPLDILGATTYTPKTFDLTISAGQYLTGVQTIKGDANLVSEHIISDITIFGVTGSAVVPSGNINITTLNSTDVTNYATAQVVDANLIASNIKEGVSVLGLTGTFTSDANAASGDIISGKTAYVNGTKITGNIPTYDSQGAVTVSQNGVLQTAGTYFENDITVNVSSGDLNINGETLQATIETGESVLQGDFVTLVATDPSVIVRGYNSVTDTGLPLGVALQSGEDGDSINIVVPYTNYAVITDLTNCTFNGASSARKNQSYFGTITPNTGYNLTDALVTVTMGGVDITSTVYNNGSISIDVVTGTINIFAVCAPRTLIDINNDYLTDSNYNNLLISDNSWEITKNLTGCYLFNPQNMVSNNTSYYTEVGTEEGYVLVGSSVSVTITMGGVDITSQVYSYDSTSEVGVISIDSVTGDLVITIQAVAKYSITTTGTNCTISDAGFNWIVPGITRTLVIYPDPGYTYPSNVTVTNATPVYDSSDGTIVLSDPTDDVTVEVTCIAGGGTPSVSKGDIIQMTIDDNYTDQEGNNTQRFRVLEDSVDGIAKVVTLWTPNALQGLTFDDEGSPTYENGSLYQAINDYYTNGLNSTAQTAIQQDSFSQDNYSSHSSPISNDGYYPADLDSSYLREVYFQKDSTGSTIQGYLRPISLGEIIDYLGVDPYPTMDVYNTTFTANSLSLMFDGDPSECTGPVSWGLNLIDSSIPYVDATIGGIYLTSPDGYYTNVVLVFKVDLSQISYTVENANMEESEE